MKFFSSIFLFGVVRCIVPHHSRLNLETPLTYTFDDYLDDFSKVYKPNEYDYRKNIFDEKIQDLRQHNSNEDAAWKVGINLFTDMTHEEFKSTRLGYVPDTSRYTESLMMEGDTYAAPIFESRDDKVDLPDAVDWRSRNAVTAVKDQGRCGSCWAFAATETVESYAAIASGRLIDLSVQQILDCSDEGSNGGCDGGNAAIANTTLLQSQSMYSEFQYPYRSYYGDAFKCNQPSSVMTYPVNELIDLSPNNYDEVMNHLAYKGPLMVIVDATNWHDYASGVYDGCPKGGDNVNLDHAVQLIGYGTDTFLGAYWIIRNSWSPMWGEGGLIRLRRESGGPSFCNYDTFGDDKVKVCGACGVLIEPTYARIKKPRNESTESVEIIV